MTTIGNEHLKRDDGSLYLKPFRPKSIGDGRRQIVEVFEANKWDERSVRKYFEMQEVDAETTAQLTAEDIRKILDSMQKARMIIYREG